MTYDEKEKKDALINLIRETTIDRYTPFPDQDSLDADSEWATARFLAKVIYESEPLNNKITKKELFDFASDYQKKNNIQLNVNGLFEKFWLREVLGSIKIPSSLRFICLSFEQIKDFKKEVVFLQSHYQVFTNKSQLKKKDIDEASQKHHENIKWEALNANRTGLINIKDDNVTLADKQYIDLYLKYWDELAFILAVKNYRRSKSELLITKKKFQQYLTKHKSLYPNSPALPDFLTQGVIRDLDEKFYAIQLLNTKPAYWRELGDKIAAGFWSISITDTTFDSDEERIQYFMNQFGESELPYRFLTYVSQKNLIRFIDAAFDLLKLDEDSVGINKELERAYLDILRGDILTLEANSKKYINITLSNTDTYELYDGLKKWDELQQSMVFQEQSVREKVCFLISIIVKYDLEIEHERGDDLDSNPKVHNFKRIFQILELGKDRPIVLWYLVEYIVISRRELIPYLILSKSHTSLAFHVLDQVRFPEKLKSSLYQKLWIECFELTLLYLRSLDDKPQIAKTLFQIFKRLNATKYEIPYNRTFLQQEAIAAKEKREKENAILSLIENSPSTNQKYLVNQTDCLLPSVFNELFQCFAAYNERPPYNNGIVQFPLLQWDGLAWLMKCSTYWKYKAQFSAVKPEVHSLTNLFFSLYISRIETDEIEKYNFFQEREEKGLPLWSEKIERLQHIEWIYPIYFFYKQLKLNNFLEPRFIFDTAQDKYHEKNRFMAEKLRTHIGVLLQVLRRFFFIEVPYGFELDVIGEVKERIERQIIDYVKVHSQNIPQQGRIDLFDYQWEIGFNATGKEALLPEIARSIAWFSDKEAIINALLKTGDIVKLLTLLDHITSEGIKETLIEKLSQTDLQTFLQNTHWIPEIQTALIKVSRHPQLINQIKEIAVYWEANIAGKTREYSEQLFQVKLLLAYFDKNEKDLNNIPSPSNEQQRSMSSISSSDHKEFYRALLYMESNPIKAHHLFDDLVNKYGGAYPVFAMNRMAARINEAKRTGEVSMYAEAFEEWNAYQTNNPEIDPNALGKNFIINNLFVLWKTNRTDKLDSEYEKLELPYKMLPELIDIKVQRLIDANKTIEALDLLETAGTYHKFSSKAEIAFIDDLKQKVCGIDNVAELQAHYTRIFQSPPGKLINIFPENLNGRTDLREFIVKEVALAVLRMLQKIKSIDKIQLENPYNDLVQLALESRIVLWGWRVKDQTRMGTSRKGDDLGEIDLDIQDSNSKSIVTCEAFILRDQGRVKTHLEKLLHHYTPLKDALVLLIYCKEPYSKFDDKWLDYRTATVPQLTFPIGYEIDLKGVEDLTTEFGYPNSAIKIGKSIHGAGIKLFHVFVNINYYAV